MSFNTMLITIAVFVLAVAVAQDYYAGIDLNAKDEELKEQLHTLISEKTTLTYDEIWAAFAVVDKNLVGYPCDSTDPAKIPDIYSSYCWSPTAGLPSGGECGSDSATKEGACYNREHTWPNSWFGGNVSDAYTDLFLLYPSDGYVNNHRGNLPLGTVSPNAITYKSTNGCLIGTCTGTSPDYEGACFEPPDSLKGDMARTYFYISVAYMNKFECCEEAAVSEWVIRPWEESILRAWHALDPVDESEKARNEAIYSGFQHNRNPFIDYPDLVDSISDF